MQKPRFLKFLLFYFLFLSLLPNQAFTQCTTSYNFTWDNGAGSGAVWAPSDVSKTYTNIAGSGVDVTVVLTDPDDQNCDLGNPSTFSDYTETTGGYGNDVLTWQMTSTTSAQEVTFTFTFTEPIFLDDFAIFDLDNSGYAPNSPVESFQDELSVTASNGGTNIPVTLAQHPSATSSIVIIDGQTARSTYTAGVNGGVADTDPNGAFVVSTSTGIDRLVLSYSNGPDDDGQSDDHAIKFPGFTFCKAPADTDLDGIIDLVDIDDDNDGILDELEVCGSIAGGGNVDINVEIQLDNYPGETSWTLSNSSGGTVASGSGYGTANDFIDLTYNVAPGDYTFNILDTYGDGLSDVGGYYQIKVDGSIVVGPVSTAFSNNSHPFTAGTAAFSCIGGDPSGDADNDGTLNYQDADFCTLNANGVCASFDTDGDGIPDHLDLDSDGDGCFDADEAGHTETVNGSGEIDGAFGNNGFDNDLEDVDTGAATPNFTVANISGSGSPDYQDNGESSACAVATDTDGDGVPDSVDIDDDNDGIPDTAEERCDIPNVANATSGSGIYQDQLYFFNWDGTDFADGLHDGDSQTFNLADGLSVTATVSAISNATAAATYIPSPMLTWGGAFLYQLYDGPALNKASLYGGDNQDVDFTISFTATKNGHPFRLDFLALDSESTASPSETITFITNGGGWTAVETYSGGGQWSGVGTQSIQAIDTEYNTFGNQGNTIYVSKDASSFTFNINAGGREGVALGIFLVCDVDNDGIPNHIDLDADNDGIPDIIEAGGVDTNGDGLTDYPTPGDPTSMVDLDGDGLADIYDDTDSAGGTPGWVAGTPIANSDSDGDGYPNYLDLDADNDGIPDIIEAGGVDTNGDGVVDVTTDSDNDGYADSYDPLDDGPNAGSGNTGTAHFVTGVNSGNGTPSSPCADCDTDGDGLADYLDLDTDNDGIPDIIEAGGVDTNGDGVVDVTTDSDNDGYADSYDPSNGMAPGSNEGTAHYVTGADSGDGTPISPCTDCDSDGDGLPDHLDLDADNDGIPDIIEAGGTDTDGDGLVDSTTDSDNDGYADTYDPNNEDNPGNNEGTAHYVTGADSGDGTPSSPCTDCDKDRDGIPDHLDLDADNDGLPDIVEAGGIDTNGDGRVDSSTDSDNDGYADVADPSNEDNPGNNEGTAYYVTGSDSGDGTPTTPCSNCDKDKDGLPDHLDLDADNDGIPDVVEVGGIDTNGDGQVDVNTDADGDGLADIYDENASDGPGSAGTNGTALVETNGSGTMVAGDDAADFVDTDGDNLPDHLDLDADNDGVPDLIEAGGHDPEGDGFVNVVLAPWDSDGDGLADVYDTDDNTVAGTGDGGDALIQTSADTNNDGRVNATGENMVSGGGGSLPINSDGDALANHLDIDADNDGIMDVTETGATDSNNDGRVDNGAGVFVDADGDGFADGVDGDVGNDFSFESGNPLVITSTDDGGDSDTRLEYAGNGTTDSDADDVPDFLDVDSDNDGIYDNYEGQATAGYVPPGTADTDGDGLLDAYDQNSGAGQNGITPYNHDSATGDTTPDYLDLDSDGDNIPDQQEAWDDLADGDSQEDNVSSCANEDADGDGLVDCFDSNDADASIYTWAGDPANDSDGANGTAAGTVFMDDLDVILPDNIGNDAGEPDYRDNIDACTGAQVYYGITEASTGTTTEYEYDENTGRHVNGAGTKIIRATTFCEPDADGWYYFYNPLEKENYLFAIKNNASSPNTVPMADLIDYIEIKVAADPTTRHVTGASEATLVMERDWNVVFKGTPTSGSSFDVKFYFRPEEMAALDAAVTNVENNATNPVRSPLKWFKKPGGLKDSDIEADGVIGMTDITANDPVGVDESTAGTTDGSGATTGNGRNYVEFIGLTSFSGGTASVGVSYAALPVELSTFEAKSIDCANHITWVTASEKNFSHFELERSSDGRNFSMIEKINAKGGIIKQAYQYIDEQAERLNYYRLKMVDFDGTVELSNIVSVASDCDKTQDNLVLFPNPARLTNGVLNIKLDVFEAGEKRFIITDVLGKVQQVISLDLGEGPNNLQVDISSLSQGTYFLNLDLAGQRLNSKKFIIIE